MDKSRSYLTHDKHQDLFNALFNSLSLDDAVAHGEADVEKVMRKQDRDDEDPSAGPNQGKSPAKTSKSSKSVTAEKPVEEPVYEMAFDDIEQTVDDVANDADQPPDDSTQTKTKIQRKIDLLTFDELMATLVDFSKYDMNRLKIDILTQAHLVGPVYELLKGTCKSNIELKYNMEEYFKAFADKLDWNNPKGDRRPFDLTKPLPLKVRPGRLTVAAEYFFNNDLNFLKSSDPKKKYTTSIIKTKATRYEIVGIEDMVPTLWSATKKILSGVSVNDERLHGYGHLDEIAMKRADRQLNKFQEGDFVDLHLNDIEDRLPLLVQHKLFHLNGSDIVDFIVALYMFIRSLIIKRRVEDLQLSVESYQKKLNINKYRILKTVRDELHHRILNFRLGYNKEMSRRKWSAIDKRRSELMVKLINKQMRERRIIRNLERLVGAQELEMDYRLMPRTV
uniref:Uncharacterized protein n=1 Tax=Tanacetum cinerariifolium TaxID=118510 RepID=A0A6L2LTI3_TANCI|nr:hypothetical protein [Tanacetum cinerariifolium]